MKRNNLLIAACGIALFTSLQSCNRSADNPDAQTHDSNYGSDLNEKPNDGSNTAADSSGTGVKTTGSGRSSETGTGTTTGSGEGNGASTTGTTNNSSDENKGSGNNTGPGGNPQAPRNEVTPADISKPSTPTTKHQ